MGKRKGRKKLHIHLFELMLANAKQAQEIRKLQAENDILAASAIEEFQADILADATGHGHEKPKHH